MSGLNVMVGVGLVAALLAGRVEAQSPEQRAQRNGEQRAPDRPLDDQRLGPLGPADQRLGPLGPGPNAPAEQQLVPVGPGEADRWADVFRDRGAPQLTTMSESPGGTSLRALVTGGLDTAGGPTAATLSPAARAGRQATYPDGLVVQRWRFADVEAARAFALDGLGVDASEGALLVAVHGAAVYVARGAPVVTGPSQVADALTPLARRSLLVLLASGQGQAGLVIEESIAATSLRPTIVELDRAARAHPDCTSQLEHGALRVELPTVSAVLRVGTRRAGAWWSASTQQVVPMDVEGLASSFGFPTGHGTPLADAQQPAQATPGLTGAVGRTGSN